jgi:hypothetical protein
MRTQPERLVELERLRRLRGRVSPLFIDALVKDFEAHGVKAIARTRRGRTTAWAQFVAALMSPGEAAPSRTELDEEIERLRAIPIDDDGFTTL